MPEFRVVVTDQVFPDVEVERELLGAAGGTLEVAGGNRSTVLDTARDADALLNTYFPLGATDITRAGLDAGIAVIDAIRSAVGTDIEVMVELHGLWYRRAAEKICNALVPYQPYWVEDPMRPDAADSLAALAADIDVQIATGETCCGRRGFLPLLRSGSVDVVTVDTQWTGGLTEARKVASLADAFGVPIAPHDCTGPVSFAACVHLVASQPNGLIQETVRAFLRTWYGTLIDGLPEVSDGHIAPRRAPGLGIELSPGLADRADVRRRETRL